MGRGGRRRTKIDVEEVVLNPGRSPQTLTPLLEPWLHHNHGPGGLQTAGRLNHAKDILPHTNHCKCQTPAKGHS